MFTALKRLLGGGKESHPPLPGLPPGIAVYAVGDIHGCLRQLKQVFRRIDQDAITPGAHKNIEVYLGDYVDRGPDSAGVIDCLIERSRTRHVVCIKGNHEDLLEQFSRGDLALQNWMAYGGSDTLRSYGATPQLLTGEADALRTLIPPTHLEFIANLSSQFQIGPYFFTHAGVRPGRSLEDQSTTDLMWIREEFLDYEGNFGAIVIHGHTPSTAVDVRHNRICVDTGAYMTGKLSCIRIDESGPKEI